MTGTPISWLALQEGTQVVSSDGREVGKVTAVVADETKDIFSGVAFKEGLFGSERFVPADQIAEITNERLTLTIEASIAQGLPGPA